MKVKNWKSGTGSYKIGEIALAQGELVTNNDFSNGTTGWGKLGSGSFSVVNGIAELNLVAATGRIVQTDVYLNLEAGKRYKLSAKVKTDNSNVELSIGTSSSLGSAYLRKYYSGSGDWETLTTEFTAVGSDDVMIGTATAITSLIQVDNVSITEIPPLPDLDTGAKYLEDTSAGTAALPSKTAAGTWEWNVYKGAGINNTRNYFISSNLSPSLADREGYGLFINSNQGISIRRENIGSAITLLSTAVSYISDNTWYKLKVARLQSEGVFKDIETLQTGLENSSGTLPYDTFKSNDKYSFSATNASGTGTAGTYDEISLTSGEKYLVEFDLKLNSGELPTPRFRSTWTGDVSNSVKANEGRNSMILTATSSVVARLVYRTGTATDYEVSGLTIRRIYDADTFAVFIKGGDFGTDKWTLVDTTGGSGSNPVTDGTYKTSNYLVTDLDAGDRFTNLKINNGVKQ